MPAGPKGRRTGASTVDMLLDILKAFLAGALASVPVGPAVLVVLRRTLSSGPREGFVCAGAVALVDTMWALLGMLALVFCEEFLAAHETAVLLFGGAVAVAVGLVQLLRGPLRGRGSRDSSAFRTQDFASTFLAALSNPAGVVFMFGLLAFLDVDVSVRGAGLVLLVASVALGALAYWWWVTSLVGRLGNRFSPAVLLRANRVLGIVIILIGTVLFSKGLLGMVHAPVLV